jgi:hypothetical protein
MRAVVFVSVPIKQVKRKNRAAPGILFALFVLDAPML